jgi:hypothetical protein
VFCDEVHDPKYRMALGTIVMPVYDGEDLYSWISRYVGDDVNGVSFQKARIQKYYNMPGRSLATVGYNLDQVLCYSTVVIVEGILDAIRTGPFATCLFTKSVPETLKKRILRGLQRYRNAVIVVMLDPMQNEKDRKRGVRHPIEQVAEAFRTAGDVQVVTVYLPDGHDPGSMHSKDIHTAIRQASQAQGVKISFKQRREYVPSESTSSHLAGTPSPRPGLVSLAENARRHPVVTPPGKPKG